MVIKRLHPDVLLLKAKQAVRWLWPWSRLTGMDQLTDAFQDALIREDELKILVARLVDAWPSTEGAGISRFPEGWCHTESLRQGRYFRTRRHAVCDFLATVHDIQIDPEKLRGYP